MGARNRSRRPPGSSPAPQFDLAPQFDADFEEIMKRLNEDDQADQGQLIKDLDGTNPDPSPTSLTLPDATPPSVLEYDAQTLLDDACGMQVDEDELLRSIEDIPGP